MAVPRNDNLRLFEGKANIKNKKLYGAVAGLIVESDVRRYALKKGLYVLEIL